MVHWPNARIGKIANMGNHEKCQYFLVIVYSSIWTKYEGIPVDKSVGTMVVERFVDLISIAVIGFILFVGQREKFLLLFSKKAETAPESPEMTVIKYIVPVLLVLGISGFSFYVWKKHGIEKFVTLVKEKMSGFLHGLQSIRNLKNPMAFIIHSILVWVCYIFMTYFAFRALPETTSLDIWACLACLFFGGFAMVATPGGLGVFGPCKPLLGLWAVFCPSAYYC